MTPNQLMSLAVNEAMKFREKVVEHRECCCGRKAWLMHVASNGIKEFMCNQGHQTITIPIEE